VKTENDIQKELYINLLTSKKPTIDFKTRDEKYSHLDSVIHLHVTEEV